MTNDTFQAMELPVGQVVPSPINVRTDVGDVSELTDSIREQGILEPLVVRPTQDGKYEVINRLAALGIRKGSRLACCARGSSADFRC